MTSQMHSGTCATRVYEGFIAYVYTIPVLLRARMLRLRIPNIGKRNKGIRKN